MKFELTRKLLVGFVCVAMVFGLFSLPISAQPSPVVNQSEWLVVVTPTSGYNPVDTATHTVTIYTYVNGTLADPASTASVAAAVAEPGTPPVMYDYWIDQTGHPGTGVFTADIVYGTDTPAIAGEYLIYGFIDADGSGGISEGDVISDPVT